MVHSQHALGGRFKPDRHQPSRRLRAHPLRRRTPSASSGPDPARHYVFGGIEESPRYPLQSSFFCASAVAMNNSRTSLEMGLQFTTSSPTRPASWERGSMRSLCKRTITPSGLPQNPLYSRQLSQRVHSPQCIIGWCTSRANHQRAEVPLRTLRQCGPCVDPTTTVAAPVRFQPLQLCASCAHCRANATHPHHTLTEGRRRYLTTTP